MPDSFVLVAGSDPERWQQIQNANAGEFALAFAIDLRGTLDMLADRRPQVLIVCSDLLDVTADELIDRLCRDHRDGLHVVVTHPTASRRTGDGFVSNVSPDRAELLEAIRAKSGGATRERRVQHDRPLRHNDVGLRALPAYRDMILGTSAPIRKVAETVRRIARVDVTVLLSGETGTGKELFARRIHCMSNRGRGPFRAVNLPAVPRELFESVLFGHERGAFTGAVSDNLGAFAQAEGGTLFLDELSSLSMNAQPKLLRAIQEREVERVGARGPKQFDVRIVAATNTNLLEAVERREFRDDLYHRLSVVTIEIPPLRERREDLPLLVDFFLKKYAAQFRCDPPTVSAETMRALQQAEWKGNIRQLENCCQRALLLSTGDTLRTEDFLTPATYTKAHGIHFDCCDYCLADVERAYIERVLEHTGGNQSRAAELLGIDRKTLRAKRHKSTTSRKSRDTKPTLQSVS